MSSQPGAGPYSAIRMKVTSSSLFKPLRVIHSKKCVLGKEVKLSLRIENVGNTDFPSQKIGIGLRLVWPTDQIVVLMKELDPSEAIEPGKERVVELSATNCMCEGYALAFLIIWPPMRSMPFKVLNEQGIPVEIKPPIWFESRPEPEYNMSKNAVHTFLVARLEEVYSFWVFILSVITTAAAILAVLISLSGR